MSLLEIIILAIVQGLTEFLPVSSSGHLVVASALFESLGFAPPKDLLEVNIVLHIGTLFAILVFYWRQIVAMVGKDRRVLWLLVVGTIPAAVIGIPLKMKFDTILESPMLSGCMFPITGLILLAISRKQPGEKSYQDLSITDVVKIGLAQAFALLPGISRSGSTISAGLGCGLTRESAGTFAFLLAIPAIGGAGAIEVIKLVRNAMAETAAETTNVATAGMTSPVYLLIGAVVSMVVGFGALSCLIRWVQRGQLAMFAWYLVPVGVAVVIWQGFFV